MELDTKLVNQNRHVRDFAKANRLRTVRLPDGELVLPLGPRKRAASGANHLGSAAWFAGNGTWRVFVQTRNPAAFDASFAPFGANILHRDGELEVSLPEASLLNALDAQGDTFRPWRKRSSSPERMAQLRALVGKMNRAES